MWGKEDVPISAWDLRENIRPVFLDWRRDPLVAQAKGRDPLVTQADLSAPHACSPAVALLHKKGPRHRRKICANSLWLYSYYTQWSPSKNKNINYICIYLQVLHCLSTVQYTTLVTTTQGLTFDGACFGK